MTQVALKVNEEQIRLNEIMSKMLTNIVTAFVTTLSKIPENIDQISVDIKY